MIILCTIVCIAALIGIAVDMYLGYKHLNQHRRHVSAEDKMFDLHNDSIKRMEASIAVLDMLVVLSHDSLAITSRLDAIKATFHEELSLAAFVDMNAVNGAIAVLEEMNSNFNKDAKGVER